MKFFLFISITTAIFLGISVQMGLTQTPRPSKVTPSFLRPYQQKIKSQFERPENANILFAFITGNKNGISPHTKKAFKRVNLSFLFSPSGIHLAGILLIFNFFLKKIKVKWLRHTLKALTFSSFFLLPHFESIKRLMGLRLLFQFKFLSKLRISTEQIFIITFGLGFILGQYKASPLGFIYSFAFLGTFFALRDFSKITLMLGLYSTQLILALFMGEKVSLLSIPCGLIGSFVFSFLFPILLIFIATFWCVQINWIEPLIRFYVVSIQATSKLLNGSFTSASLFLIIAIWVIMFPGYFKKKYLWISILLIMHTNTAMTPVIFVSR